MTGQEAMAEVLAEMTARIAEPVRSIQDAVWFGWQIDQLRQHATTMLTEAPGT